MKRRDCVSGTMDELRRRMLARQKQIRRRDATIGGLTLVVVTSSMGFIAVFLWHQIG